jgi:ribosomal protein L37E
MTYNLSIIIPARSEMFLMHTVEDLLKNIRGNTEIIVVLDGYWPAPPLRDDPRVTIIHNTETVGQRAATNQGVKLSNAKYVAKCDAHCSFDEGFDVKLLADMRDDWTMVPVMRNLHAFDWKCKKCGNRTYQGPTPTSCAKCDNKTDFKRSMVWRGKENPQSVSYCFDAEPHFQYFKEYTERPEYKRDLAETQLTETMSFQGSFFLMTREKYWELNICDENFGSWGNQGLEVACKTWLSGGRCVVSHKTWYAHMFRTQGGDFGFPYPQSGKAVQETKLKVKSILCNKELIPLIKKFWPVPGWDENSLKKLEEI